MLRGGNAVDLGEGVVDRDEAQVAIEDGKTDGRRLEIGREQFLRIIQSFGVGEGKLVAGIETCRIIPHGRKPQSAQPGRRSAARPAKSMVGPWFVPACNSMRPPTSALWNRGFPDFEMGNFPPKILRERICEKSGEGSAA